MGLVVTTTCWSRSWPQVSTWSFHDQNLVRASFSIGQSSQQPGCNLKTSKKIMKSHIAIDINTKACDSKASKAGIEDSCPVCMEIFKNCQKIFEYLPCHHFCCHVCTVKMKKFRQIEFKFLECPLCRETVTKKVKIAAFSLHCCPCHFFSFECPMWPPLSREF